VVSAAVLGFAAPAYAHHSVLAGSTECFDGDHLVNWSIQAVSVVHLPMTIASATATIGGVAYPVTGYKPTIDDGETTHATTTVPGGTTGTITLHVHSTWPDGVTYDDHTSVDLITDCHTTTTETTTTTTTTTTLPPTTTTIGEQGSTTTAAARIESTTTTIGEQGSTTTTQPGCTSRPPRPSASRDDDHRGAHHDHRGADHYYAAALHRVDHHHNLGEEVSTRSR
jgi:uncharacterized membrane protein